MFIAASVLCVVFRTTELPTKQLLFVPHRFGRRGRLISILTLLVLSGYEPVAGFRTFIFRRVRSDDVRRDDDSTIGQQSTTIPSSVDGEFVQNRLRHLHAGVGGRVNKPTDCYDV